MSPVRRVSRNRNQGASAKHGSAVTVADMRMLNVLTIGLLAGCVSDAIPIQPWPKMTRNEAWKCDKPIEGITVDLAPETDIAWTVTVTNQTDDVVSIVWDRSAFVGSSGRSWGRLVPGETRRMDVSAPHPPTPVVPHATAHELAVPMELAHLYGDPVSPKRRRIFESEVNGGRVVLVLQMPSGEQTWQATLTGELIEQ